MLTTRVDDDYLAAAGPQLRIVANYGVGVDNIDLEAARRHGVLIANTPDVLTEATAELAIALTLALLRRVAEGDRFLRARRQWLFAIDFMLGEGLSGKCFGIVGAGRIGRAAGRLAEAHGARPLYAGRGDDLTELLTTADVVSLHCPLTPATRHLIDAAAFERMKPTAVLVNTARGAIVDEHALVAALQAVRSPAPRSTCTSTSRGHAGAARAGERGADAAPRQRHPFDPRGDGNARGVRAANRAARRRPAPNTVA